VFSHVTANEAHPTVAGLDRAYVAENPSEPWEDWYAERVTDEFAA
jgi:hypothetical protein